MFAFRISPSSLQSPFNQVKNLHLTTRSRFPQRTAHESHATAVQGTAEGTSGDNVNSGCQRFHALDHHFTHTCPALEGLNVYFVFIVVLYTYIHAC